jgi:hypothetical protein
MMSTYKDNTVDGIEDNIKNQSNYGEERTGKRGQIFFGCCCDMRRAVIVVNTMNFIAIVYTLLMVLIFEVTIGKYTAAGNEEDEAASDIDTKDLKVGVWYYVECIFILAISAIGIYGAKIFSAKMVGIAGAMWAIRMIYMLVVSITKSPAFLGFAIISGIYLYPHIMFILENRRGIMVESNYHNEKQSCCCV